jgi:RNA polymerase sigma-70 factor (ECF subfamily)
MSQGAQTGDGQDREPAEWRALSDDEVVRRVLAGEGPLYEILMRRYNQRLFRVACSILRDAAEAEDVMQHAYVEAYRHLDQFEGRAQFATWLTKIAVYEALSRARRRTRLGQAPGAAASAEQDPMSAVPCPALDPEQQAAVTEARGLLEVAIRDLPEAYRSVFVLREIEALSTAETAACLDTTEEVVKTRLHRARAYLRESLLERVGAAARTAFPFHLSRCDVVVAGVFGRLAGESGAAPPTH